MKETKLVYPEYCHEEAVKKFVHDICKFDQSEIINGSGLYLQYQNFHDWIVKEKKMHLGIEVDTGFVPGTTYLYMKDSEVIGMINIRHCLNDNLLKVGGHIGYSIHPRYRKQGYATLMLMGALQICRYWEIMPVLVTCDKTNIASRKTIEKCGGVLEDEYFNRDENKIIQRFWIEGEK